MPDGASDLRPLLNVPTRVALGRRPVVAGGQGLRAMVMSVALHAALLPAWWASLSATPLPPASSSQAAGDGAAVHWSVTLPMARAQSSEPLRAVGTSTSMPDWEPPPGPAVPEPPTLLLDPAPASDAPRDRGPLVDVGAHTIRPRARTSPGRVVARVAPWPALARLGDRASHDLTRLAGVMGEAAEAWADRAALERALARRAAPEDAAEDPAPGPGGGGGGFVAASPAADNAAPRYPGAARRRGWEGTVTLAVSVSPEGRALAVGVARSSGRELLDRAAVAAVTGWRFRPALRGGEALADDIEVIVAFRLEDGR